MHYFKTLNFSNNGSAIALLCIVALAGMSSSPVAAQMSDADVYEHVVKPQEEKRAAEVAEIMARPSNWGPGEIRSNGNYGGIAWYRKSNGDYGYIVARGYISPTSATVQMEMECDSRRVACEGARLLTNEWLAIGKRSADGRYLTASAKSRLEAEAIVMLECKKMSGDTCVILDAFDVMPHKRGMSHLRPKVIQK
jgi:hypothetical protein